MSRLLDWIRGRGRDPLTPPDDLVPGSPAPATPSSTHHHTPIPHGEPHGVDQEEADAELEQWARELGVDTLVMRTLVEQRRALVFDVAADPRGWGFDLLPARASRRDAATTFRRQTRLTGSLGDSFLAGHRPLLSLVPDPPTMPDGTPLDRQLVAAARLDPEPAAAIARHIRATIQARLGAPLDRESFEHAVREAAWDHDLDAANVIPAVLSAVSELV